MRICILTTGYPRYNGDFDSVYIHRLARTLAKMDIEVHVVAPHANGIRKEELMEGVFVHRFQYMYPSTLQSLAYSPGIPENIKKNFNKFQLAPFVVEMSRSLTRVVKRYDINIVNAHWAIPTGLIAILAKRLCKIPVVTKIYGVEIYLAKKKYPAVKGLVKKTLLESDKVIANSSTTRDIALSTLGVKIDVEVIPDPVDVNLFSPRDGERIKAVYGLQGCPVILSCGRLVERKGFHYLIQAMPTILNEEPTTRLAIVGEGPEKTRLMNLVSSLGLNGSVIFLGKIPMEKLPECYAMSDIFVLPAIVDSDGDTEGLGLVLVEAMASGKPVIGSDVGGIPYIIREDGEYGFLVQQRDPIELSERIITLLRDEELRKKLGARARKLAEERFGCERIARQYLTTFERVIRGE